MICNIRIWHLTNEKQEQLHHHFDEIEYTSLIGQSEIRMFLCMSSDSSVASTERVRLCTYQSHAPPTPYRAYVGDWVGIRLRKAPRMMGSRPRAAYNSGRHGFKGQGDDVLCSSVVHVATFWTARSRGVCIPTLTIWVNEDWQ